MRDWKGCTWALCFLFLLLRPAASNILPQEASDEPVTVLAVPAPIFSRDAAPAIRNPVLMEEEVIGTTTTTAPVTTTRTTTARSTTVAEPARTTTEAPAKITTTNRYRASRIELKKPAAALTEAKNTTAAKPISSTTPRAAPKIQMKTPSQLQKAAPMGLKESLIMLTDQLRQGIKSEAVQTGKVEIAKKPSAKSNQEEIIIYETSGHDGVAMPLTMEDIEREMAQVEFQLQESTPKEGISTWILLSGTETTPQPSSNVAAKGPQYYVETEKVDTDKKVDKIMKVKDDKEKPVVLPKRRPTTTLAPVVKAKPKRTTTTTTTPAPTTTTTTTTTEAPVTAAAVKPVVKKVKPESRVNVKRLRRPTTTTTTTEAPETTTEEEITEEAVEESTFMIIEPKDSEFDLPADRSPYQGKKKTSANPKPKKTKKKPDVKDKKKPGLEQMLEDIVSGVAEATKKPTKNGNKKPEKPVTTQIMNYLSREVMPTVGVGLVGLVAAAGIATYFLGSPLSPLRRNDRTDEIYYNNNEEYAGPDGQYEEEWFSKVIAGSPTYRNNLRQSFKPAPAPAPAAPSMTIQQQANYAAYKYPQYSKYARAPPPPPPGPQYNPNHRNYNVRPNYAPQNYRINSGGPMPSGANPSELVRKHSMAMPNNYPHHHYHPHAIAPQPPAPPMAPAKEPETKNYFSEASKRHSFSSSAAEIQAERQQEIVADQDAAMGPIEDNNFLKRTSQPNSDQFVVGSVYPEALTAKDPLAEQAESVPEHGPRRRRRRGAVVQNKKKTKKLDDNELDNENEMPIPEDPKEEEKVQKVTIEEGVTEKAEETSDQEHVTSSTVVSSTMGTGEDGKVEATTPGGVLYYESVGVVSYNPTFSDFIRRMVQLKLKLGVSFLRGMADGVARYLHQFEERLYRSTNYNTR